MKRFARLLFLPLVFIPWAILGIAALAGALSACGGLASTTPANVDHATRLTAASYRHQDAGTAGAALIREAYCDLDAISRDEKLPRLDAGIPCN